MSKFMYPQSNCYVVYAYGKNKRTESALKLLEPYYPIFIDCEKHYQDIPLIISELNQLCCVKNTTLFEFEFPIIFKGLDLIGNYDDLIHYIKTEIQ